MPKLFAVVLKAFEEKKPSHGKLVYDAKLRSDATDIVVFCIYKLKSCIELVLWRCEMG